MNGKALAAVSVVAAGMLSLFFYLKSSYNEEGEVQRIPLQQARQIIQQIKYQMLIVSCNFAEQMSGEVLARVPAGQLQLAVLKLKTNLMQIYQQKEDIVLNKHAVTKDEFAQALERFEQDEFIAKGREDIRTMMEGACEGTYPDLSVPQEAMEVNSKQRVRDIYQRVCEMVVGSVWKKLVELSKNDPSFNCKDDEHYKVAVRLVNVYQLRVQQLQASGYNPQWGCPNQIFFKVMQQHKLSDGEFKVQTKAVEKAYNYILEIVSNNPFTIQDEGTIHVMMEDEIEQNVTKLKEEQAKLKSLKTGNLEDEVAQVNYLFEKGKIIQNELNESKAKMASARDKHLEPKVNGSLQDQHQ